MSVDQDDHQAIGLPYRLDELPSEEEQLREEKLDAMYAALANANAVVDPTMLMRVPRSNHEIAAQLKETNMFK